MLGTSVTAIEKDFAPLVALEGLGILVAIHGMFVLAVRQLSNDSFFASSPRWVLSLEAVGFGENMITWKGKCADGLLTVATLLATLFETDVVALRM